MTIVADATNEFDPFAGFVLGMAVGDAIGLPREGMSSRRARRVFGSAPISHRFVLGRGMVSDDTEHMRMTALALLSDSVDPMRFGRILAWKMRWWFVGFPAGMGLATAKSIIRLWLGWSPSTSGIHSAGNGPAMRAGVLGLCLHREGDPLSEFIRVSTRLTHTDPRAEIGALLIARAARSAMQNHAQPVDPYLYLTHCRKNLDLGTEWLDALERVETSLRAGDSAVHFLERMGLDSGVTGYIVHTVATVLFCWFRWPGEFRRPIEEIILLGGDVDTTAAILGGLAGASCGVDAIPVEWIERLVEWPFSVTWMRQQLAKDLRNKWHGVRLSSASEVREAPNSDQTAQLRVRINQQRPLSLWVVVPAQLGRNAIFLVIVLMHGFRRLLPPY